MGPTVASTPDRSFRTLAAIFVALALPSWRAAAVADDVPIEERSGKGSAKSAAFFAASPVVRLRIEVDRDALQSLRHRPREYVRATVREGDRVWENVGIHLKGAAGSFRHVDDKPALTLNFDKFAPRQRFHGIDKLHLNNSVQDPSYLSELVCSELFNAAGVPAPRVAFARVVLAGRDRGFYVLKEGFDPTFLERHFERNDGNLYDGGFLRDIHDALDKSSGADPENRSDLAALEAALRVADLDARLVALERVLDVERFIAFAALESMTWHWDGYVMNRNNYRIYGDPISGRLVFLPHGMDQMFGESNGPVLPHTSGAVAQALFDIPAARERYHERFRALFERHFRAGDLAARIETVKERIRPAVLELGAGEEWHFDQAVSDLIERIRERGRVLARRLGAGEGRPLSFAGGAAHAPAGWEALVLAGAPDLEITDSPDGVPSLVIRAGARGASVSSWRAGVTLGRGRYRFEGRVRTASVEAVSDEKGAGAGLRISGSTEPRGNGVSGTGVWQDVAYEFTVDSTREVVLVCELRASRGTAWFDAGALRLRKL